MYLIFIHIFTAPWLTKSSQRPKIWDELRKKILIFLIIYCTLKLNKVECKKGIEKSSTTYLSINSQEELPRHGSNHPGPLNWDRNVRNPICWSLGNANCWGCIVVLHFSNCYMIRYYLTSRAFCFTTTKLSLLDAFCQVWFWLLHTHSKHNMYSVF